MLRGFGLEDLHGSVVSRIVYASHKGTKSGIVIQIS